MSAEKLAAWIIIGSAVVSVIGAIFVIAAGIFDATDGWWDSITSKDPPSDPRNLVPYRRPDDRQEMR